MNQKYEMSLNLITVLTEQAKKTKYCPAERSEAT